MKLVDEIISLDQAVHTRDDVRNSEQRDVQLRLRHTKSRLIYRVLRKSGR